MKDREGLTPAARLVEGASTLLRLSKHLLPTPGDFASSKISEVSKQRSFPRVRTHKNPARPFLLGPFSHLCFPRWFVSYLVYSMNLISKFLWKMIWSNILATIPLRTRICSWKRLLLRRAPQSCIHWFDSSARCHSSASRWQDQNFWMIQRSTGLECCGSDPAMFFLFFHSSDSYVSDLWSSHICY